MKQSAVDKLVRVVVLVRWKQFAQHFPLDIRAGSQVIGEAWRNF